MTNPLEKLLNLKESDKNACLLHGGQKSILAVNPIGKFTYKLGQKNTLNKFLKKHEKKLIIGYFSYDLAYELYDIKPKAKDDLNLPDIYLLAFEKWETIKPTNAKSPKTKKYPSKNFKPEISKSQYDKAYKKIKKYIKEGDIYQLNLTHRLKAQTETPSRELFVKTIKKNPVEFSAYIEEKEFQIISASPERFIKIKGNKIQTCPVKGTRPRGKTAKQDEKLKQELLKSEKEKAELNMITDLLRNDLGKVCKAGTVKVKGERLLSKCPTVWHTYSDIIGELKKEITPVQALISMLPGGSITGCPKKRAIEIIDELEPKTRSLYTGVIGYIMPYQKELDFSIAIRTIIKKGDKLYLQVGGGIVQDSKEQDEYDETLQKAASFMEIL